MSRRFRGLAAWCALKAYGREGYQALVERCVENATSFARWVDWAPNLELMNAEQVHKAPLNCICFRFVPPGLDAEATDAFNRAAVAAIQDDGRAFVTGTSWEGKAAIRAAFDNWATTLADVEILQKTVEDAGAKLQTT
jgi:glutamate/tyrosine decarboxylase-like PLP-dependent enzyme